MPDAASFAAPDVVRDCLRKAAFPCAAGLRSSQRERGRARGGPMRARYVVSVALPCLLLAGRVIGAAAPLPPEQLTIEKLPPRSPHWVYVYDDAFDNEIDARVHLFDGDSYRRLDRKS